MKEQKLNSVKAHLFEDHLIVSLDKKWIDKFDGMPTFDVKINTHKRLCLSSQVMKSGGNVNE